ncbi:GGDEF domain-containing protein [Telmatocola sphagniphila]|uniref:diguanylate cyclase n=1 Tax=Telmatocola sphagniphila TaxID=1123043 RepID=A0A8E6B364_9BACT|nr:GGDEF domain-containing protein [Telmatocola sphagniphila]QVL30584.1 GGDEF domain-containing protein [Telmatocola sphagniphila]
MDRTFETTLSNKLPHSTLADACLVHIYPTGPAMGRRYVLRDKPLIIGRGEDCDISIQESSVSRRHARIEPVGEVFYVLDLQSTNGTFINDKQLTESHILHDGDYLRVGNCIYRFLVGGNIESEYHEEIYRLTIIDALTQTHNVRYLSDFLDREVMRSNRHKRPLCVAMIDIDLFRQVNEDAGHLGGDFCLRELSHRIKRLIRREDLFARYGGEEFVLVLVETKMKQAYEAADRLRQMIAEQPFKFEDKKINLTVSIGISECLLDGTDTAREILKRADANLYKAKRDGRNRVIG